MIIHESILRMRLERGDLPYWEAHFGSKTQSNAAFESWSKKILISTQVRRSSNMRVKMLIVYKRACSF